MMDRHPHLRSWVLRLWAWFIRTVMAGRMREQVAAPPPPTPLTPEPAAPLVPPPERFELPAAVAPVEISPLLLPEFSPSPPPVSDAAPRLRPPRVRRPRPPLEDEEEGLQWRFQSVILDRLEEYFHCMKRLRRHDRNAYRTFSRLGFTVLPDRFAPRMATVTGARPTMGGYLFPKGALGPEHHPNCRHHVSSEEMERSVYPSFVYFRKIQHPYGVQYWRGDVYELTQLYDDRVRVGATWVARTTAAVGVCHFGLGDDGTVTLLRERRSESVWVPGGRRGRMIEGSRTVWRTPRWIEERVQPCVHCPVSEEGPQRDPVQEACETLTQALATHTEALSRIVVRVKHDGCVAAFGIELLRAPRFFRDREATALARDGRRKRIFHFVRRHARQVAADRQTFVREHYRGIRTFDWNGYGIHIVLPANAPVYGLDIQTYDPRTQPLGVATVPESTMVDLLERRVSA